jgi:TolB-like protein
MDGLPEERVQAALEELLGWPAIARSPQLARFLSYIVMSKLRGEEGGIKAYAIAVDVFGRPPSFDPQSDPIVRVQARRLRTLLDQFYDEGLGRSGVQIQLPVGRYVPDFVPLGDPRDLSAPPAPAVIDSGAPARGARAFGRVGRLAKGSRMLPIAAGVLLLMALGAAFYLLRPPESGPPVQAPRVPSVLVGEFSNLTGLADLDQFGLRLAAGVTAGLSGFEGVEVGATPARPTQPDSDGTYVLDGLINAAARGIEVTAVLTGPSGETLWTGSFAQSGPNVREVDVMSLAQAVVREIAPFRGPLHERGRRWLDEQARPLAAVNGYVCLLTYQIAREGGGSNHVSDALACHEALLARQPDLPAALSAAAWLEMRAVVARRLPAQDPVQTLSGPLQRAQRALSLAPGSSLAHEHVGAILNWQNAFGAALQAFAQALQLNPLNTDARANSAVVLQRTGDWALGRQQADLAIAGTPYPSPWYHYPVALDAFRAGDFEEAIAEGLEAARYDGHDLAGMIALAAATRLGRPEQAEILLPRVLNSEALRRTGIRPWLEMQLRDDETVDRLADALAEAGVPHNALTGPF